jgi:8-oxo-dGTP diphosphatase
MSALVAFGAAPADATLHPRRAAYAVIRGPEERVAAVRHAAEGQLRYWLPGGGLEDGETPEAGVVREIGEELGFAVRTLEFIGEAVQHFWAGDEGRWYRMTATFYRAELGDPLTEAGTFELAWIAPDQGLFFHECHGWAATLSGP